MGELKLPGKSTELSSPCFEECKSGHGLKPRIQVVMHADTTLFKVLHGKVAFEGTQGSCSNFTPELLEAELVDLAPPGHKVDVHYNKGSSHSDHIYEWVVLNYIALAL
jgi:hypothetical protein